MKIQICCFLLLISSCTMYSISSHNISPEKAEGIRIGMTHEEIVSRFGHPLFKEELKSDGTEFGVTYTVDHEDGASIYCRDLNLLFQKKGGKTQVVDKWFSSNKENAQQRCDRYAAEATSNSRALSEFYQSASKSLTEVNSPSKRNVSSEGKFCSYRDDGSKDYCHYSLSQCQERIKWLGKGFCIFEKY